MAYNPIFATLYPLKSLFSNGLQMSYDSWTTLEHKTPESKKSEGNVKRAVTWDIFDSFGSLCQPGPHLTPGLRKAWAKTEITS